MIIPIFLVLFSLSTVNAVTYNLIDTNTSSQINTLITGETSDELVINLDNTNYSNLGQININRNVTIVDKSRYDVKMYGTGRGNLFFIIASNVKLINLTIFGYRTSISSTIS